jgi:ribosomal protein L32
MATPKKKISRSRRNMRRFAGGNRLEKPTFIVSSVDQELTRPHRITKALLNSGRYLEATAAGKKRLKSSSAKA